MYLYRLIWRTNIKDHEPSYLSGRGRLVSCCVCESVRDIVVIVRRAVGDLGEEKCPSQVARERLKAHGRYPSALSGCQLCGTGVGWCTARPVLDVCSREQDAFRNTYVEYFY